ncbi:MAG: glycosyltransferase family 39 protein [Chloroflexi bacterium]|nr:glycosyltransferase family 39 protein [Chloroflexota bacterium]
MFTKAPARHPILQPSSHLTRADLLLILLIALVAFFARVMPEPRTVDDAFITFRYSRNLVEGEGFVYNSDSKVLGTTTPLYTLLIAGIGGVVGDDYQWYALFVNALADAISVALLYLLARHLTNSRLAGGLLGLLWGLISYSVTFAIGGMETSVHNLFMIAAWVAYLDRRRGWVGALVALGLLTRPDALLWAGPLMLHQLWTAWRERTPNQNLLQWLPFPDYIAGLIIGLPWVIFAAAYFGSPLPHTIGTKSVVYDVESTQALIKMLQQFANPVDQFEILGPVVGTGLGLILFPFLALVGLRALVKTHPRTLPIFLHAWIYLVVFCVLNPLIFRWYLTPPMPAYLLAIVGGVYSLGQSLAPSLGAQRLKFAAYSLSAFAILCALAGWQLKPDHRPNRPAPKMAFHELESNYQAVAERLVSEERVGPATVIAAGDIGTVGFYSHAKILDTIGLVTDGLNHYYEAEGYTELIPEDGNYAIPPQMIFDRQPDYIITMLDFVKLGLQQDPRFAEQYQLLYEIKTDYYGGAMLVYKRIAPANTAQ